MLLLGLDIGSSSVKVSIVEGNGGKCISCAHFPKQEMEMIAVKAGWAEQHPESWWGNAKLALKEALSKISVSASEIGAIGISYQMHGLVVVGKDKKPLRPSIIWCDSRAVEIGNKAFHALGEKVCLEHYLNSPGNFTASKLKWVKENEPEVYDQIWKIMLPGDYIALRLTGEATTTVTGLSEGIMWDFKNDSIASDLLNYYGISESFIPTIVPCFGHQGTISKEAAAELGLSEKVQITYRAGDQPNNAFSLNVLNPGEVAATAGTSGVVYGVSGDVKFDPFSRVNPFAHVNHSQEATRLGVLLCINGTGILNSWVKKNVGGGLDYPELNALASKASIGSDGLVIIPFGNGAERILKNEELGASIHNINFNIHQQAHIVRAAQEGIAFSFQYGLEIMHNMGIQTNTIRAGRANMFLSSIFLETVAGITGALIELYETDGAQGAARGAGIGVGYFKSTEEAFSGLKKLNVVEPNLAKKDNYQEAYSQWLAKLKHQIK